ncbi:23S rRNA (cytidine1920-2'-O)/16S rRNA (cytidine1409-2'-O)-methyltransferase [Pseudobacteriovorax antillogorgiicola]|uniref:23S rRNA (Cytidine1920-2'-O)/16S rRNA (Cytidine1409-2'-O)-methyltransferase n=2 Tax=Pseudobacteriovorax antillogorgiicola TaxID=1513793 RepID=A0A1Y6BKT1_9BACT|nr:23S rRNA (cytidine1920-2'-O)/16S rRNA (cytidine1409-2'-O)-methyltransferase [Pseudobacteriovorax antillogorgiicola]SMF14317.1 23S rRNA (cytidine1920-2'-O)/16S rRNA (cytidine1409-2'-O)-methyltransferase [Pseudobacteriovorax antillogorgiicola]
MGKPLEIFLHLFYPFEIFCFVVYTEVTQRGLSGRKMGQKLQKVKLYEALVERGLAESHSQAKALIMAGKVVVDDQRADKAGQVVESSTQIRIKGQTDQFVSRGGWKLQGALADFSLLNQVPGMTALDVGASTGGFTDCLLQAGADKVYALDVGTNQLAWSLRQDPRVVSMEKTDIRRIESPIDEKISLVVADISFNSLRRLLPSMLKSCPNKGVTFLLLVKPQFELDAKDIPSGGVVNDDELRQQALLQVRHGLDKLGIHQVEAKDCRLAGRTGNREIFICFKI